METNNVLSKHAEALLKEILEHRNSNGLVDTQYFFTKLEKMDSADEEVYRSCFGELSRNNLVKIHWADNGPYIINLTALGLEYFNEQKNAKKALKKEKKQSRRYDIWIAGLSALFGGIITLLLYLLFEIG